MPPAPPAPPDRRQVQRWLTQHVLLGLLQLGCVVATLFSAILTDTTTLAQVQPITWLLGAAFVVVTAVRFGLFLARGRPNWHWLEQPDE